MDSQLFDMVRLMTDELYRLYIEPTSRCNLSCSMCFRNTWIGEKYADMDISTFGKAIETMPASVRTVFFGGMGEPLFHEDIVYMVNAAAAKGVNVELLTNATLLTHNMAENLLDAGLCKLWISIDSVDTGESGEVGHNGGFALIKRNIAQYNAERAKRGNTASLCLAFVAMKSNVTQLAGLSRFAHENGIDEINVSNMLPTDSRSLSESLYTRIVSLELNTERQDFPQINLPFMDGRLGEVRDGISALLMTDFNLKLAGEPLYRKRRYCRFVEEGMAFVRHDGEVSPCMALLHSGVTYLEENRRIIHHHSFGNVNNRSLMEIWRGSEYTDFRNRVRSFDFSPCVLCGGCENREDNRRDCIGNETPTCGACLWAEGVITCP